MAREKFFVSSPKTMRTMIYIINIFMLIPWMYCTRSNSGMKKWSQQNEAQAFEAVSVTDWGFEKSKKTTHLKNFS